MPTSGADVVVASYLLLGVEEREEAFQRIHQLRVDEEAADSSEAALYLRCLLRVAEDVGRTPTVDDYKEVQPRLAAAGEHIESFSKVYRFYGSWVRAREAVELSDSTTAKRIEARFRYRRVGKVWRYTEVALQTALMAAADHWGRPPSVAEFEWWRDRELELAKAAGDAIDLPSSSPYRKRWGTWEAALLHFGFTPEQVALRLEGKSQPHNRNADPYLPDGLPVADLRHLSSADGPLSAEQTRRVVEAYNGLAKRSRYVLTVRLGLGVEPMSLKAAAEPLALSLDRIRQLQVHAIEALSDAASGPGRKRPKPGSLRDGVVATLKLLGGGRIDRS